MNDDPQLAFCLGKLGELVETRVYHRGDYREGLAAHREALLIYRKLGDEDGQALALGVSVSWKNFKVISPVRSFVRKQSDLQEPWRRRRVVHFSPWTWKYLFAPGRFRSSLEYFEALGVCQAAGDLENERLLLRSISWLHLQRGALDHCT